MRRQPCVSGAEHLVLDRGVLNDGLDQQIGLDDLFYGAHALQDIVGRGAALLRELAEALAHRLERAIGRTGLGVEQRDLAARGGYDLRDPATHLTRADHENVANLHRRRAYPSGVNVRRATPEDAEAIERIRIRGWQVAYRHLFPPEELDRLPLEWSRWIESLTTPQPGFAAFVAEGGDGMLG